MRLPISICLCALAGVSCSSAVETSGPPPPPPDAGSPGPDAGGPSNDAATVQEAASLEGGLTSEFVGSWHPVSATGGITCSDGSTGTFNANPSAHLVFRQADATTLILTAADGCVSSYRVAGSVATLDPPGQSCTTTSNGETGTATWSTNRFTLGSGAPPSTMTWQDDGSVSVTGAVSATCSASGTFDFVRD